MFKILFTIVTFVFVLSLSSLATGAPFEIGDSTRTSLDLTVYQGNLGVVNDRRNVTLPTGELELALKDIVMTIDPRTASIDSQGFEPARQNFRFDLLNRRSLLERFVGRKLKYSRFLQQEGSYEKILREGILLSIEPEIVRFGDVIEIDPEGTISLPYLPDDLITEPTLFLAGSNSRAGEQLLNIRYHAPGFSWEADYTLTLADEGDQLQAWVTVMNETTTELSVDRLRLVAGQINQVHAKRMDAAPRMLMQESMAAAPVSATVGDYHLYEYPAGASLQSGETTRLNLFNSEIEVSKSYRTVSGVERYAASGKQKLSPTIWLNFNNRDDGPNEPMPAGVVRVYQVNDQADTFLGEARVGHTPVADTVDIPIGQAFDLTGHRTQTVFRRLGDRSAEMSYEIELSNSSDETATVALDEKMSGDWRIVSESITGIKVDASTYRFKLKIEPGESERFTFSVRING